MDEQPNQSAQSSQPEPTAPEKKTNPLLNALVALGIVAVAFFVLKFLADNAIPDAPGVMLTDMSSVEDLRSRFNQDYGAPRLVLLLSPT